MSSLLLSYLNSPLFKQFTIKLPKVAAKYYDLLTMAIVNYSLQSDKAFFIGLIIESIQ